MQGHAWTLKHRVEVRVDHDRLAVEGALGGDAHNDVRQIVVSICHMRARKDHVDCACCLLPVNLTQQNNLKEKITCNPLCNQRVLSSCILELKSWQALPGQ